MDEEASEWVFDFMMNLFHSPSWEVPIMCFIDENCASFDTGEENKFIYSDLHEQFRELVESILCANLADLGLTGSDFADICQNQIHQKGINKEVVTQILAMDDFLTFKKLMTKRNLELELEVLETMQKEADFLQKVECSGLEEDMMHLSILHKQEEMEQAELEAAIAMSMALQKEQKRLVCVASKTAEDKNPSSMSDQGRAQDLLQQLQASQSKAQETLKKNKDLLTEKKNDLQQASADFSEEEIKQREKYLKEQRDRIVAKKKQAREEQLKEFTKEQKQTSPDPPAQVAEKIKELSQEEVKRAQDEEKRNTLRVALARRMKQDLLNSDHDEPSALKELDEQASRVEKLRRENQTKESNVMRSKAK